MIDLRTATAGRGRDGRTDRPRGRTGHRRPEDRRSFGQRLDGALVDVAVHRVVAYGDLAKQHFGGHPYAARRGIDRLKREGLVVEHVVGTGKGVGFKVVSATRAGAKRAEALKGRHGYGLDQRVWGSRGKLEDLRHDAAIYRAVRTVRAEAGRGGGTVQRVRLDAELRGIVASRTEKARTAGGPGAARAERLKAARELGLPVKDGKVLYPDAQVVCCSADGRETGRVNVEVATEHYRAAAIAGKAAAGMTMFASNAKAARSVSAALLGAGRALGKMGGEKGRRDSRGEASIEL